jgi:LysM repeat protein
MTLPALIANHVHVSEREVAHTWPDGRRDDARWEDCTWDTAVEYARAVGTKAPATHAEAEKLRSTVKGPLGGSNPTEVQAAFKKRYKLDITIVRGFEALWAKLVPGTVACVALSMSGVPRLRKWSRFTGAHSITIFRVDKSDHVWWCDPLAPTHGYSGEWASKAELKRAIDALPFSGHFVGKIAPAMGKPTPVVKPPVVKPPVVKPPVVAPPPVAPPATTREYHTVVDGDTLWNIAVKHGTITAALYDLNPGLSAMIRPGQSIRVK